MMILSSAMSLSISLISASCTILRPKCRLNSKLNKEDQIFGSGWPIPPRTALSSLKLNIFQEQATTSSLTKVPRCGPSYMKQGLLSRVSMRNFFCPRLSRSADGLERTQLPCITLFKQLLIMHRRQ